MNKGILTFSQLGSYGHAGNQIFQINATISAALQNNMDYVFPTWKYSKYYKKELPQLPLVNIKALGGLTYIDREGPFEFKPIEIPDPNNNWDLGGYLQSELYWEPFMSEILSYYEPKDEYVELLQKEFGHLLSQKTCSIHFRGGDYRGLQHYHPVQDMYYYGAAIDTMDSDCIFLVFSDEPETVKRMFQGEQFHFINYTDKTRGGDVILEHILMSMCNHNITANSSFSLTAAMFNKNPDKKVICPRKWFGPAAPYNTINLYPKGAIII
jgi:hypothetical protein